MKANFLQQNIKRTVAGLLAVWMSGVIVLFCCEMPSANATGNEVESCPLAKKGDCSKTFVEDAGHFFGQQPLSLDCCGFPAKIFDKVRKLEDAPQSATVTGKTEIVAPKFSAFEKTFRTSKYNRSLIRNHDDIYLRNRVFRI